MNADRILIRCSSRACLSVMAWPFTCLGSFESLVRFGGEAGWSVHMVETTTRAIDQRSGFALALQCPRCAELGDRTEQRTGRKLINI